ncbi:MAG TPA: 5-(carboxyamino)imidazole ribonucleotide synthase [Cyclobacteriaceae bacterium]|nr:5-(carboxyamino)imidazole ribonucleotide synthase [Cyclobacteriaceae bacterium]
MEPKFYQKDFKLGVLGGGQLGRMLIQSGIDFNITFSILDPDATAPCHQISDFTHGKLTDYNTVMAFGKKCDLVTIEIENVNTKALKDLEKSGKKVFPQPHIIELIQDKRTQKEFFQKNDIPTAEFILTENRNEVKANASFIPAVNKLAKEGYDGRGVQIIRDTNDLDKAFDAPGLLEKLIDFDKEIAVIVAKNESGEIRTYPPVEMVFHPEKNLVEYLFAPANISEHIAADADRIARRVIESLGLVGILAVEMFVTREGKVLVNEIAPRPHNSGHHTIEANETSQYEQHLRAILNQPLGATSMRSPSAMVNLLGEDGYTGDAQYQGLEEVLKLDGVHVHLYGKKVTKPFRKMGHVTIVDKDVESLNKKATFVKEKLKVIA